jgi:hypothetical protein
MDWKVLAALGFLGLALIAGFVICIATSVNAYAKRLTLKPEDKRRGFEVEVKQTTAGDVTATPALTEKDDHHG